MLTLCSGAQTHTHNPTVSAKASIVSETAPIESKQAAIVSQKFHKTAVRQRSSIVSRKLPTVSREIASKLKAARILESSSEELRPWFWETSGLLQESLQNGSEGYSVRTV